MMDSIEKIVPFAEEEEKEGMEEEEEEQQQKEEEEQQQKEEEEQKEGEEKEEGGEGEDDLSGDEGEEENGDDEDQEIKDEEKKEEEETKPTPANEIEKNVSLPVEPSKKKQDGGLNLNNEVVKMRKEVKRVRALIIRKLTRQIATLKKKKGNEMAIERNQRRAARLKEEIDAMKALSPDLVTKTALQKKLNFEQVCKNPKSTISDRAIARIATHPQYNKRIEDIKAAVKAFKEERKKGGKQERSEKGHKKAGNVTPQTADKKSDNKDEKEEKDSTIEENEIDSNRGDSILKDTTDVTVAGLKKESGKATHSADPADGQTKETAKNVRPALAKKTEIKNIVKDKPQSKDAVKTPDLKCAPEALHKTKDEEESDLELSDDEEKEYFDDSTEERFHKQSSQSEYSDDDDFFVGKVSKFKKKKKQKSVEEEKGLELKVDSADPVRSKLDVLESRPKPKATSLQSVFCSSLSSIKPGGGRGAGRGRGGDKFRGRGNPRGGRGLSRDFSKQPNLQKQEETESNSESKYSKSEMSKKSFPFAGRGRGRGRGDVIGQNRRGGGAFSHQAPQQALHPSWEASKKRKEQQGQILAFQGKKIKFDDD